MIIALSQRLQPLGPTSPRRFVVRVTENAQLAEKQRSKAALLVREPTEAPPADFRAYLQCALGGAAIHDDTYLLPRELHYLADGDVVRIDPANRRLRTLYRRTSPSNFLLVTERCDNFCIMCSQPPRAENDDWLVDELYEAIPLIDKSTGALGITGGEPGLLGARLVGLLTLLQEELPTTAVHILSNGRAFADAAFARAVADVHHADLMIGIPVYSDVSTEHDYVVQAVGAFDETVRGVLNLKAAGVRVEIRVVIHKETHARLPELATFIARNLTFVDHVALMGLELTGFAKTNLEALWIDPIDYADELVAAARTLRRARVPTSIYNHQLCVLEPELRGLARKSISDWKNAYAAECDGCAARPDCGGFFASSSIRRSRAIRRLQEEAAS